MSLSDLQPIVDGFTAGSLYALTAASINVMYRPTHMFNFAQGTFVAVGALTSFLFLEVTRWPWLLALLSVLAAGALLGGVVERLAVFPVLKVRGSSIGWVLTTLAVSLIIENALGRYATDSAEAVRQLSLIPSAPFRVNDLVLRPYEIAIWVFVALLIAAISGAYRSKHGLAVLALAQDREAAYLRGIRPAPLIVASWCAGGAIALLVGFLAAPVTFASISLGPLLLIKGFEAAALGGLGSNRGALAGGLAIGCIETFAATFVGNEYRDLATFLALLAVLLIRPVGVFGQPAYREV